ncbi:MAG: hypothetical protein NEA02_10555 [Thermoanaerobaculia bacterium]|nr:hypothetical protein [Thermoanaerobaculia bacterium]
MSAEARVLTSSQPSQWIASPRWDLVCLTLSAALVAVPPLVHSLGKTTVGGVDLLITFLIGGPHMYATFLKTVFEPRFRKLHPALTWAPVVVVPIGVILGVVFAFPWLLTFFFTWASIHVCDQASFIGYLYREKGGAARPWQRLLDFSVVMTSLYSYAMYRHVAGTFRIGETTLWFPAFLKHAWFADSFAVLTAALIATWVVLTVNQLRRREVAAPYVFFMALTIAVALLVPRLNELSVSFQGFNAWHSFQYLGLTYLILRQDNDAAGYTFVRKMAQPGKFFRYYGWNLALTTGATLVILLLTFVLRLPAEPSYYAVVLSFLLTHYAHDHFLFAFGAGFKPK